NDLKFAIGILDVNCQKYDKFCFLLQNKPVLILLRDPIDSLKSFINVRHQKNGFNEIFKIDINNTDFDKINDRIVYVHESNGCFNPDTNQKFPSLESIKALSDANHWMLMYNIRRNKTIEFFRFNKIIYIDMMDIVGDK
ncbi:sugar transferase, partial [Campylobacter jejuni]|nr:sugar transferase [Campylobacter jejuni]